MFTRAFTLIELLIVVAIIAILAAIAVPNFLEAQTRAKISRVRSDFRTLATAIETYGLDHNAQYNFIAPWENWIRYEFESLTTPISYISSVPADPFIPPAVAGFIIPTEKDQSPSAVYLWYDTSKTLARMRAMEDYLNPSNPRYEGFKLAVGQLHNKQWFLVSQGPKTQLAANGQTTTRRIHDGGNGGPGLWPLGPYDATNGTLSFGLIVTHN